MRRFAISVLLLVLLFAGWVSYVIFVDRSHPAQRTDVIIARGSTFAGIAQQLAQSGVIGNATVFRIYARIRRADTEVHSGAFRFSAAQTQAQVLHELQSGGAQIAKWLTIPEGYTAKQIAQALQSDGLGDAAQYEAAFLHDRMTIDGYRTTNLEGYLFPDTYLIPIGTDPPAIERLMTGQFRKELPAGAARKARVRRMTLPQIVTLASLVEREAKADDERPLIAGVYYNRLRLGMPLEVDATIEYVLPQHATVITYSDLRIDSPYNTYLHSGLPPTPIANPGLPSIRAALDPRSSDFLYYVYKGHGRHVFARTLSEQNANIEKYLK